MAGDWIPMRVDLQDDPAVIAIALELGLDEFAVIGRLHRLWSWANRQLTTGAAQTVTESWVDRYVTAPGFAAAMLNAGWLRTRSGGVEFPNFDRWNSQGAKRRLEATQRKQKQRVTEMSREKCDIGHAGGGTKARPEKRREEKRREDPTGGATAEPPPAAKVDPVAPREKKPPSGPHAEAIRFFVDSWAAKYGKPYPFDGPKDGAAVKAMLAHVGGNLDDFRAAVDRYFANSEPFFSGHRLSLLRSQLAKFLVDVPAASHRRPGGFQTHDDRVMGDIFDALGGHS